ncbi:serine/threonine-protein kinase GG21441-like [Teleopsis dalmanni]|uniref:serine/threonine-protein kinase GG21441-like n=1 Tax=Teleopsis dalmanni TaxID=139649 RepID=UPI0018CFCE60|nr:serine/threonine-protein kinase GG21441-like [Teleopsis dalmanni]
MNNSQIQNNRNCFCRKYIKKTFRHFFRRNTNPLTSTSLDDENTIFYFGDDDKYISLQNLQSLVINSTIPNKAKENTNTLNVSIPTKDRIRFFQYRNNVNVGISVPRTKIPKDSITSLLKLITQLLIVDLKLQGTIVALCTCTGRKITFLEELKVGETYICHSHTEPTNNVTATAEPVNTVESIKLTNIRRPNFCFQSHLRREGNIRPRTIIVIKSGPKPRRIQKVYLNQLNCLNLRYVQQTIAIALKFNTERVDHVFTLWGLLVENIEEFFGDEDIFFACGSAYFYYMQTLVLDWEDIKTVEKICMQDRSIGLAYQESKYEIPKITTIENSPDFISKIVNDSPLLLKEKYVFGGIIGEGHFAVVMKIKKLKTKTPYAVKIVKKIKTYQDEQLYKAEINILLKIKHPHIVFCKEIYERLDKYYIVMDYISGGNLYQALLKAKRFSEADCRLVMKKLFKALVYIHSKNIIHRDIKLENVLVQRDVNERICDIKLTDFGLSTEGTETSRSKCGTPLYMAPELVLEICYDNKVDVWSAGVMMFTLLCGDNPFQHEVRNTLYKFIIIGKYKYPKIIEDQISIECKDLIKNLLKVNPNIRFSSKKALRHYWFNNKKFK